LTDSLGDDKYQTKDIRNSKRTPNSFNNLAHGANIFLLKFRKFPKCAEIKRRRHKPMDMILQSNLLTKRQQKQLFRRFAIRQQLNQF
jgi:hypothetical protein